MITFEQRHHARLMWEYGLGTGEIAHSLDCTIRDVEDALGPLMRDGCLPPIDATEETA